MNDDEILDLVRQALIWAKAPVLPLGAGQLHLSSKLAESPICLDSLEAIAMVTHLEDLLGLVAEDEHFFAGSVRTVADVVLAVKGWVALAETSR